MSYSYLILRRNRGWPSPEDSWGLSLMFGESGWCHACGTPKREQIGSLRMLRSGLNTAGAWMPNWRFDTLCLGAELAAEVEARFGLELRPVLSAGRRDMIARQLVIRPAGQRWFDPALLNERTRARHGSAGTSCSSCGMWRWLPLDHGELPPIEAETVRECPAAAASPEWFGTGCKSFRELVFRTDLAEFIAEASPRDFTVLPAF